MAHGNKKKIIIILISIVIVVGLIILMISLFKKEKDHFSSSKELFFEHALMYSNPGDIEIKKVDAYYYEGYCYYHTFTNEFHSGTGERRDLELVYFGREGTIGKMLNPNWEDKMDLEDEYQAFLKAKEEGEHYKFSDEEIAKYVEEYYQK